MAQLSARLERLIALESQIAHKTPPPAGEMEFACQPGTLPLLISAPHGAAHWRQGKEKEEDEYTSGLARLLGELTGAHVLYARCQSNTDPNFNRGVPYKQRLAEILDEAPVHFVLDLHGCAPRREFGLALGTMKGRSCPGMREEILDSLCANGFHPQAKGLRSLDVDKAFPALGKKDRETVTGFVWGTLGVPAAQLEINAKLRILKRLSPGEAHENTLADPWDVEQVIDALCSLVFRLARDGRA